MTNKMLVTLAAALALALGTISPALAEDPPADDTATTTESTAAPADEAPAEPTEAPQE
jgi:hypothetical protein